MPRGAMAARAFLDDLTRATALVAQPGEGRSTFAEIVAAYDDYHHAAALDGHEGTVPADLDDDATSAIRLHAEVQALLDRVYHPVPGSPERGAWGDRITAAEAEAAIRDLSARRDAPRLLLHLQK